MDTSPGKPKIVVPPPGSEDAKGRPKGTTNANTAARSAGKIESTLNQWFTALAMTATMAGDDVSAVVLTTRGPALASAWAELAKQNPAVRRTLERMMTGSAWSGVILATLSVALPIADARGVLPPGMPNPFAISLEEAEAVMTARDARAKFSKAASGDGPAS